jgi:hypothetical protein
VLTCNVFESLRTNDIDTENTGAENKVMEQEAPRKPGKPPPIMMTSTTNLIRLQSSLKTTSKESTSSVYMKWNPYHNERNGGLFSHEILPGEK